MGTDQRLRVVSWEQQASKRRPAESQPRAPAHRSVMVIEQAKQRTLFGMEFTAPAARRDLVDNWTERDQTELEQLIRQWDRATGLDGLNQLIDNHPFSDGTHRQVLARGRARPC